MRRLEVPCLTAEDLYSWIYKAERYFHINRLPEVEEVTAAMPSTGSSGERPEPPRGREWTTLVQLCSLLCSLAMGEGWKPQEGARFCNLTNEEEKDQQIALTIQGLGF